MSKNDERIAGLRWDLAVTLQGRLPELVDLKRQRDSSYPQFNQYYSPLTQETADVEEFLALCVKWDHLDSVINDRRTGRRELRRQVHQELVALEESDLRRRWEFREARIGDLKSSLEKSRRKLLDATEQLGTEILAPDYLIQLKGSERSDKFSLYVKAALRRQQVSDTPAKRKFDLLTREIKEIEQEIKTKQTRRDRWLPKQRFGWFMFYHDFRELIKEIVFDWALEVHNEQANLEGLDPPESDLYFFKQEGEFWKIGTHHFKDRIGFHYIAHLLRTPGVEVLSVDLVAQFRGGASGRESDSIELGDAGEMSDSEARQQYRKRLHELLGERAEAEKNHDQTALDRINAESIQIEHELRKATGLGGKPRRVGSKEERIRQTVAKAIKRARDVVAKANPPLGAHLARSIITGEHCRYLPGPDDQIHWEF